MFPGHGGQGKCLTAYGTNQATWSRWERGAATPSDVEQRKLAEFFGISVAELRNENAPAKRAGAVKFTDDVRDKLYVTFAHILGGLAEIHQGLNNGAYDEEQLAKQFDHLAETVHVILDSFAEQDRDQDAG